MSDQSETESVVSELRQLLARTQTRHRDQLTELGRAIMADGQNEGMCEGGLSEFISRNLGSEYLPVYKGRFVLEVTASSEEALSEVESKLDSMYDYLDGISDSTSYPVHGTEAMDFGDWHTRVQRQAKAIARATARRLGRS